MNNHWENTIISLLQPGKLFISENLINLLFEENSVIYELLGTAGAKR